MLAALDTAGVGPLDREISEGLIAMRKQFPRALRVDVAAVVMAVGPRLRCFKTGDWVYSYSWANPKGGFYAKYVVVPTDKVDQVPKRLNLEQAGAVATTGLAALQGIDDHLGVKRGEFVIIQGGSGGVGTLAVQFTKLRRAKVLATGSGPDGVAVVREMGADAAINGKRDDIAAAARRFAPDGVNAVLALAGSDALRRGGGSPIRMVWSPCRRSGVASSSSHTTPNRGPGTCPASRGT